LNLRAIDRNEPYERNPRSNDAAVYTVCMSLCEFEFRQLLVATTPALYSFATRRKAAKKPDLIKVSVHIVGDLQSEAVQAYRIADNKSNAIAV
jgi:hypothetical protein